MAAAIEKRESEIAATDHQLADSSIRAGNRAWVAPPLGFSGRRMFAKLHVPER